MICCVENQLSSLKLIATEELVKVLSLTDSRSKINNFWSSCSGKKSDCLGSKYVAYRQVHHVLYKVDVLFDQLFFVEYFGSGLSKESKRNRIVFVQDCWLFCFAESNFFDGIATAGVFLRFAQILYVKLFQCQIWLWFSNLSLTSTPKI